MTTTRAAGLTVALTALTLAIAAAHVRPIEAQAQARIDFARDVQPILRQRCIGCHGPSQQMAGLRLDRRRDAMRGSTFGTVIGPGNSDGSRLALRVSGTSRGTQMPPTGALPPEQIAVLKRWVDEGADWPDAVSGDAPAVPADPGAARLMDLLRSGDGTAFSRALASTPAAATRAGRDGITPLMYAALYGTAPAMKALLDAGADQNARNEAGATALMWAVDDVAKTELLLSRGADAKAKSLDGRTPLMIAASRAGASAILAMLLDKGADPNVELAGLTALGEAAFAADVTAMRLLLARGADPTRGLDASIVSAAEGDCVPCLELLLPSLTPEQQKRVALNVLPPEDDGDELALLLDRGAGVDAADRAGRTVRQLASLSDTMSRDVLARLPGSDTDHPPRPAAAHTASPASNPRDAVARALPILQKTGVTFRQKAGCVSCHNNTLLATLTAEARRSRIPFDERTAAAEADGISRFTESWRERAIQGLGIPGDADTISYILVGLGDEHHPADEATDALVYFLMRKQQADGSWHTLAHRPPIESSDITVTATSMHAIPLYAPTVWRRRANDAVAAAGRWLAARTPRMTEERTFQLRGLAWAGRPMSERRRLATALVAEQRPDGGWAQLSKLESDAYATGQALLALHEAAGMPVTDPVFKKGVAYLLSTQQADGTWLVQSRAVPIQPLFDIGFPYGSTNAWISAAGTNWAATALAIAARPSK